MASSGQVREPERGPQRRLDYGRALYAELALDDAAGNFLWEEALPSYPTDDDSSHAPAPVPPRAPDGAGPAEPAPGRSSARRPSLVPIGGDRR
jgi:hypothetical protein